MQKPIKSGWQVPLEDDQKPQSITVSQLPEEIAQQYANSKPLRWRGEVPAGGASKEPASDKK